MDNLCYTLTKINEWVNISAYNVKAEKRRSSNFFGSRQRAAGR